MSKLPQVGTTIFTTMSVLANETNAINLSQGFPNFPVDPLLLKIYSEKIMGEVHQYTPMPGSPFLRQEIQLLIDKTYQRDVSTENEILVTAGATQAIFTTLLALIEAGDEVIILDPSYDCYEPAVILAGGTPVRIPLNDEFLPDWDRIGKAVNERTKMIITNNPHNPSGRVWKLNDISALESIMDKHPQLLLLSDEVYEFIYFEQPHISVHQRPSLYDRSIVVSSFGKTFHVTGWKMGYLVASEQLMSEIKKVHQFNVFSVNSVAQATLATYLQQKDVRTLGAFYQQKRDLFRKLLSSSKFDLLPCEGTYFQTVSYKTISDAPDTEFCVSLTKDHGVAAIPISVFNADKKDLKIIRFCFAKDDQTLIEATQRLCRI